MKIGVNLTHLNNLNSGSKTYFENLFKSLLKIDHENIYYFFFPEKLNLNDFSFLKKKNCKVVYTKLPQQLNPGRLSFLRFLKIYIFFKNYFKKIHLDIFIHTSLPLIRNPNGKTISNIFDIRYLYKEYEANLFKRIVYMLILKYCLDNSEFTITISNFIKEEIKKKFDISYTNLKVFYCNIIPQKKLKKKNKNYILSVGHYESRKNYLNLVKSFFVLKKNFKYSGKLIIVSNNFTKKNSVINYIQKKKIQRSVIIKKKTTQDNLKKLYADADLFVFPSTYEGFGLPILEALMQNCKVLTSNIKVFREILGSKFIYFNPYSPRDMSEKIYKCLSKNNSLFNKKNNQAILKKFSSNKISHDYLKFLNKL